MTRASRCRIFISYNSADARFAAGLASELEKIGLDVWYDPWKVKPGDSLTTSISKGLGQSNVFVFIMSPASVSAPWPKEELRAALISRMHRPGFRVVPVLRKPCRIPLFLRDYRRISALPGTRYSLITEQFAELVTSLGFSLSGLPRLIREVRPFLGGAYLSEHALEMAFTGHRGRLTQVSESFTLWTKKRRFHVRREIACAGRVTGLQVQPGVAETKRILPGTIEIKLRFEHRDFKRRPFQYALTYTLRDSFRAKQAFWYYNFQSPGDVFQASLVFETPVDHFQCWRYQGGVETRRYPVRRSRQAHATTYAVRLVKPPYLEGVIFRWRWKEGD